VPRTTLYLDFGFSLQPTTVAELRDIDKKPDGTGAGTGPNLGPVYGLPDDADLSFQTLEFDFNGNRVRDRDDVEAL
jgi:hypothetical protein